MAEICHGIPPNPDVSGIGIRVAFYITIGVIAFSVLTPWQNTIAAFMSNAEYTAQALLITAVVQTAQNQLSLYHAFLLQEFMLFGIIIMLANPQLVDLVAKYQYEGRGGKRLAFIVAVRYITVLAFIAFSLYVWANVDTFGPQHECNHSIKAIIVFKSIRATAKWLQIFSIVALASTALLLVLLAPVTFALLKAAGGSRSYYDDDSFSGILTGDYSAILRSFWFGFILVYGAISALMLELTIRRNKALILPGESIWSFGQILPLVLVAASIPQVFIDSKKKD